MKSEYKIIVLSIVAALTFWVVDALVDHMSFDSGEPFLTILLFDRREVLFRVLASSFFIVCGLLFARAYGKQKKGEEEINRLNQELRLRASQLEQSYEDLESFTFTASHDLREPLVVIEWYSDNLLQKQGGRLTDEGREKLTIINEQAKRMAQFTNDLLTFSRISAKEVRKSHVDMQALSQKVFSELGTAAVDRDVTFEVKDLPVAWGDPSMLPQALKNLLSNALKYTRAKATAVIEVGGSQQGENTVYYVKDNGTGFDREDSVRLFGMFNRLKRTEKIEGTGVGLVIVKRIIEKHGGAVWAEGRVDEGATFYFSLPAGRKIPTEAQ